VSFALSDGFCVFEEGINGVILGIHARGVAMQIPEALWMLVPVARCPECKHDHWLIDEEMFPLDSVPKRFSGRTVVVIACCSGNQYIFSEQVRYLAMSVDAA
jgi:hypothetical protein